MKRMFGFVVAVSLFLTGCADEAVSSDSITDAVEVTSVVSDVSTSPTTAITVPTTAPAIVTTTAENTDALQVTEEAAGYTPEIDLTAFERVTEYDSATYLPLIEKWSDRLVQEGFDKHNEIFCCVLGEYTILYLNAWWQCDYAKAVFLSKDAFVVAEDEFFYGNEHLFVHGDSLFVHDYYLKNGYVHASLDEFDLKIGAKLSEYSEYYDIGTEITEPEGSGFGTDYASFDDVAIAMHDMTDTIYKAQWIDNPLYVPQFVGQAGETVYIHDSLTDIGLNYSHAYGMQPTKPRYTSDWSGESCVDCGNNEWYVIREGDKFGECTVTTAECGYVGYGYGATLYTQTITLDGSVTLSGILVKDADNWLGGEHALFFLPDIDDYAASGLPVTQKAELVEYQDGSTVAAVDIAVFAVGEQLYDEVLSGVTFDENGTAGVILTLDNLKYNFCFDVMSGHGCNTARIVSASLKSESFTGFDGGEVLLSDGEAVTNTSNVYRFDFGYGKASENAYYTEERIKKPHVGGKDWSIIRKGDKFGSCTVTSAECFYCYYKNSDSYEPFHQDIHLDGSVTMRGRLVYDPEIELGIGHELFFLADTVDFAASGLPVTENSKAVFLRDGTMLSAVDVSVFGLGEGEQISAILDKTTFDERGMAEVTLTLDCIRLFYSYGTMSGSGFNSARVIAIDKY